MSSADPINYVNAMPAAIVPDNCNDNNFPFLHEKLTIFRDARKVLKQNERLIDFQSLPIIESLVRTAI